jgi:phosphoribosylglycinamide formyltransferase 1
MKRVIVITSNSIRHNYFKIMFSNCKDFRVIKTYAESEKKLGLFLKYSDKENFENIEKLHFDARNNSEYDFFSDVIEYCEDFSNTKIINKGEINSQEIIDEIETLNPDFIVTYGCSIIKPKLLKIFRKKIINVHLGLSPYYFGSGTNFHCLVKNDLQCEGYTFMYMDEGIDTGEIIHQSRATILPFDNPHQLGNRLIKEMTKNFIKLIVNFDLVEEKKCVNKFKGETYKKKDATVQLTKRLYSNFANGCVINYLKNKAAIDKKYPLVHQSFLSK